METDGIWDGRGLCGARCRCPCRGGGQLYQVTDASIQTATGKEPSMEEVQKAIIQAGAALGWNMSVVKPGEILAPYNIEPPGRVSIPYSSKSYSILYKDSSNLKYDAEKQTIHENYAGWVQRLDGAIKSRLTAAGS